MRRLLAALAGVLLVAATPTAASAAPVTDLCTPDVARGGTPADFVIDACVDATTMTFRNDLEVPVLVRRDGDAGVPVRIHERGSATATLLRLLGGTDELLMPGDVTRWPLGAAAATLTVVEIDPVTTAVVDSVIRRLPDLGSDNEMDVQSFAGVVREVVSAVEARAACVEGKNFLQTAACDVDAASRISRTLSAQLPRARAVQLLPMALDRGRWTAWAALHDAGPAVPEPGSSTPPTRTLTQAAVPPPVVVPPPAVPPPVVPAPVVLAPSAPKPSGGSTTAVPVPAPAPVPVPAHVPPPPATSAADAWLAAVLSRLAAAQGADTAPAKGHGHGRGKK